jgi:hypothetical protein
MARSNAASSVLMLEVVAAPGPVFWDPGLAVLTAGNADENACLSGNVPQVFPWNKKI